MFVFSGVSLLKKERPFSTEDLRPSKGSYAWDSFYAGRKDEAYSLWAASGSIPQTDYLPFVFAILADLEVDAIRAPYSCWPQLSYLLSSHHVHAVFGGSDLLMWNVPQVITGINFERNVFYYVELDNVLKDLGGIVFDQFIDICIMAGFDWIPTFPPLTTQGGFTFRNAVDMGLSGFHTVKLYADHPAVAQMDYVDLFCRTRLT